MLVVPQDDVGTAIATFAVDETTDIYMEGIKVGEATDEVPLTLTLDMGQPISIGLKWRKNSKEALISVTVLREDSENACLEVKEIHAGRSTTLDTANPDVHIVTRKGEVFYYYQFPTLSGRTYVMVKPSGLLKVALQIVQGNESNGVGAGTYVKLYKESDENFVLFELTTPSGKYRKKYCVIWRASDTIVFSASLYTYPVLAFIDGDSQFYNYAAFPPKEPHAEYALLKQTVNKFWAEKVPKDRYGRVLLNFSQTVDLEDFTDSADYTAKNAVIDTLKTVQIGCNITEKENLLSVGPQYAMLGKNSLTDASRWIMLINGRLVDMPGFLMHTWPDNSEIITFIYTCADGLDVGYPYAGE